MQSLQLCDHHSSYDARVGIISR